MPPDILPGPEADRIMLDCCRLAGVERHDQLFDHMPFSWQKHFDRSEWLSAIALSSNHIRVSDRFRHEPIPVFHPPADRANLALVLPYQGLTINGWADRSAAKVYIEALNTFGALHWISQSSKLVMLVSPHDPDWSARQIRRHAPNAGIAGVAIPLIADMLGSRTWDPIYEACVETGLPVFVHYSGVEGSYSNTPPLSGSVHSSALSRLVLMPHLAESNTVSLLFEGAFYRHPKLQVVFSGFGFRWVPSLLRRVNQEWRNFRSDFPWLLDPPANKVFSNIWFSSTPLGEAVDPASWEGEFDTALRGRVLFGSQAPFCADTPDDVQRILGVAWLDRLMQNGQAFLRGIRYAEA